MTIAPFEEDPPRYLQEPRSCRTCRHIGYYQPRVGPTRDMCKLHPLRLTCVFARDGRPTQGAMDWDCGPEGKRWEPKDTIT